MQELITKIQIKQLEVNGEKDPLKKQKLQMELKVLNYEREIKQIKKTIEKLR